MAGKVSTKSSNGGPRFRQPGGRPSQVSPQRDEIHGRAGPEPCDRGVMTRALLAVGLVLMAGTVRAQEPQDLPGCYYTDPPGSAQTFALPNSFVVRLSRSADADADGQDCQLRVSGPDGRTVMERSGFGARVLAPIGQDLDGDGVTDAVFSVDLGGGNRCCWNTMVLALSTPPLERVVEASLGWLYDSVGKRWVAEHVEAFYQLGPDMASSPVALRFHRLGPSGFQDVTADFCARLLDPLGTGPFSREYDRRDLTAERRSAARAAAGDAYQNEQTRLAAISLALQYHLCGRPKDADALLNDVHPASLAPAVRERVNAAVESYRPK